MLKVQVQTIYTKPVHTNSGLVSRLLKTELSGPYAPAFPGLDSIVPDKTRI